MATRRKQTGKGGPARPGRRKNVDAGMKLLFMDRRMVEAFFLAFFVVCGRGAGIAFETLRLLSGEIPSVGPEGARQIDLLWKGRMRDGAPFRLILEIQGQWDRGIVRRMFEYCSLLLISRFRGAPHGSLPFLMPVVLYCGPKRRKAGAPSLLDSFVDVPRAWLANQLGIDIVLVDLNRIASETLPAGNPFRVLLEVLEALAAGSPDVLEKLGGFAGTIVAEPELCGIMADVLQHAFFGGERNRTHWIRRLTKRQLMDLMQGKATKEEKMLWYEGFSNREELLVEKGVLQGLERGRAEGVEMGRAEGVAKGRVEGMASLVAKRFGERVADDALPFIAGVSDPAALDRIDSLFLGSDDGEEFLGRLREAGPANGHAG